MEGVIKTIVEGKGYGFISVQGQKKDVFFHAKELNGIRFEELRQGDAVSFETEQGEKGPFAVNINRA